MEEAHERGARRPAGSFRTLALLLLSAGAVVLWRAQTWKEAPDELLVDDRRHDGAGDHAADADVLLRVSTSGLARNIRFACTTIGTSNGLSSPFTGNRGGETSAGPDVGELSGVNGVRHCF